MRLSIRFATAVLCGLITACAAAPKSLPPPAPPLLIAAPVNEQAPLDLAARLTVAPESQMLLRFRVNPEGFPEEPVAVLSPLTPEDQQAVLAAFSGLRFKPWLEQGQPKAREFLFPLFFGPRALNDRTLFYCRHRTELYAPSSRCEIVVSGPWRLYRFVTPYPPELRTNPVAGSVTLSFDISAEGVPQKIKVLKSTPAGVFDAAASAAVQQWYFEPLDGPPVAPTNQHVTVTVNFTPPTASPPPATQADKPSGRR
jgi:TonB family protein